jgi:hypothetical protein
MTNTTLDKFGPAMAAAQAEMPAVQMDGRNPYYKSKYATLGAVISATREVLAKHGFSIIQQVISSDTGEAVGIRTMILHESGQSMSWDCNVKIKPGYTKTMTERNGEKKIKITYDTNPGQEAGKLITYLRRYSLAAALNLYADEDIDANTPKQQAKRSSHNSNNGNNGNGNKPNNITTMTIEQAGKVTDSKGKPYIEIDSKTLSYKSGAISKSINENGHDQERLNQLQTKQQAIKVILQARAEGSIA